MSGKTFKFNEQLQLGNRGEQLILQHFHVPLEIYPGRGFDFIAKGSKKKVELKTDDFRMEKTKNFFIERWSDVYQRKPGSLWQSLDKGVDWFVYYFVRDDRYFLFRNLPALIARVEEIVEENKLGLIFVKNYGYITGGYKVPRELVIDLGEEYVFNDKKNAKEKARRVPPRPNIARGGRRNKAK